MQNLGQIRSFTVFKYKYVFCLQVSKETGTDLFCFSKPGWDERCGGSAIQLAAHTEEAHSERRLCGELQLSLTRINSSFCVFALSSQGPEQSQTKHSITQKVNVSTAGQLKQERKSNLANKIRM